MSPPKSGKKTEKKKHFPLFQWRHLLKQVKFYILYFIYIFFYFYFLCFLCFSPTDLTARRSIDLWSTLCFLLPPRSSTNHCVTHTHDWPKSRDNLNLSINQKYTLIYILTRDTIRSRQNTRYIDDRDLEITPKWISESQSLWLIIKKKKKT